MKRGTHTFTSVIDKTIYPKPKRSQIWVETVIYTLIAFAMIGLVLAYAKPKIEELQDKVLIEQSIVMLKDIDSTILNIGVAGNQRILQLKIKKGELKIDGINDQLIFEMESKHTYSEPEKKINDENLIIYTKDKGNINIVNLTRDYSNSHNIKYEGLDEVETLTKASVLYKLSLTNEGYVGGKTIININLI